jgi:hypothetical protein
MEHRLESLCAAQVFRPVFLAVVNLALTCRGRVRSPALIPKTADLCPPLPVSPAGRDARASGSEGREWVGGGFEVRAEFS